MKKISLIITSLLFAGLLFGQSTSKSTKSSISVSHHENSYALQASFSEGLKQEVSEAIIEYLGKENAIALRNGWKWEKYDGDDLAYRFRLEKKRCEILLEERFLSEIEYDELVDFCGEIKEMLGDRTEKRELEEEEEEDLENKISVHGDLDMNLSGKPVKMKINEEVFSLNAAYKMGPRSSIEKKITAVLGKADRENSQQSVWMKKSNGDLLYQFIIKNKACEIFIDKTKMNESEWKELQSLGFSVAGKLL